MKICFAEAVGGAAVVMGVMMMMNTKMISPLLEHFIKKLCWPRDVQNLDHLTLH